MSTLSAKDLRRTKQIIPLAALVNVAENHGFTVRDAKGSHVRYAHEDYPDITGTLISSTKKIGSQRSLSDAILEVQKRTAEAKQVITDKFTQAADKAAAERLARIQEQLPPYMEAFYGEGDQIILRDKQTPQIGVTLYSPEEDSALERHTRHMDDMKRDFCRRLCKSRMLFDIDVACDGKGGFLGRLSHSIYDMEELILPPYPEAEDPTAAILEYQAQVEEIDMDHEIKREDILSKDFISRILVTHHTPRGNRTNHVSYKIPGVEKSLRFTFATFSNQRVQATNLNANKAKKGHTARISKAELIQLEETVSGIEKKISGNGVTPAPKLGRAA